jgi:geranylgeranyl diphosphate synthase type II
MDAAPLRRGQATVHAKYGLNAGILSGDVMLASAFGYLLKLDNKALLPQILEVCTRMAIEVCEGQQMDMDFENRQDVEIEEYLRMIELKTSVLVAASMKMGALLAGTSLENANHLYEFGRNLGIAFQLQDDLLDSFGDPQKVGKKNGGDIAQNKKTFLFLKALQLASESDKKRLLQLYAEPTVQEAAKVLSVMEIFRKWGADQETQRLKERYQAKAMEELEKISAKEGREKLLRAFADNLMQRDF